MRFLKYLFSHPPFGSGDLVSLIQRNAIKEKSLNFAPYADRAFDDEKVMEAINTYGHICDVFFQSSKKILKEEYQHKILDYYLQEEPLSNLLHDLFRNRATVVRLGVWERMIKDEHFHRCIYSFFEDLKKQSPEGWEKLKKLCKENKFDIPAPFELDNYKQMRQELFCN